MDNTPKELREMADATRKAINMEGWPSRAETLRMARVCDAAAEIYNLVGDMHPTDAKLFENQIDFMREQLRDALGSDDGNERTRIDPLRPDAEAVARRAMALESLLCDPAPEGWQPPSPEVMREAMEAGRIAGDKALPRGGVRKRIDADSRTIEYPPEPGAIEANDLALLRDLLAQLKAERAAKPKGGLHLPNQDLHAGMGELAERVEKLEAELATANATINRVRSVLMTLHSRADSPEYSHIEDDLVFAINRLRAALESK